MDTSVQDRFTSLFASGNAPECPDLSKPHVAGTDESKTQQRTRWQVPVEAEEPRYVRGHAPRPACADEILTSSGDDPDDYVSSFANRPKVQKIKKKATYTTPKPSKTREHNTTEEDSEDNEFSQPKLRSMDKLGNRATGHFCPFNLVKTFPYKHMIDKKDLVSRQFFASNKFFERTWDLHYIHPPESLYKPEMLLLPLAQVQQLIDEIASTFQVEVCVPPFPFILSFFDDGTPQPQRLGITRSRADINDMQGNIPRPAPGHGEPPANATSAQDLSFEAFKKKIERAVNANKKKSAAAKKKKAADRFVVVQDWCKQLRRAQRYFGLRPQRTTMPTPGPEMSWAEQQAFIEEQEKKAHISLDPLDITKPAPFGFEQEPIIICLDIEAYEHDHSIVTEVGLSTLDTLDLVGLAPGEGGGSWMKQIRSRHFRLKGRENFVNRDFVVGHPDDFQFGESEFIELHDIGKVIDSCFQYPFSVNFKHDGRLKNDADNRDHAHGVANSAISSTLASNPITSVNGYSASNISTDCDRVTSKGQSPTGIGQRGPRQRKILILGHDLGTDLSYLSKLNSRVFSAPRPPAYPVPFIEPTDADNPLHSIIEALDTAILYKVLCRDSQTRSLTSIMADLGRTAWFAHCGGNDARYTLEALVGIVVKARLQDDAENIVQQTARDAAIRAAAESDPWNAGKPTANAMTLDGNASEEEVIVTETGNVNAADASSNSSPQTAWQAEMSRRIATRVAAAKREAEEENEAWDAAFSTPSTHHDIEDPGAGNGGEDGKPTPSIKMLADSQQAKAKKKTAEEKRREMELRLRREDGVGGSVDWALGGHDGWGK